MNYTTLALVVVVAAIGFYTFVATQSAAADFDTSNTISQSASNTAAGASGSSGGGTGGTSGDVSINQSICQQAGQSGAFGSSSNKLKEC
jgi:uncharacterized membrane protein